MPVVATLGAPVAIGKEESTSKAQKVWKAMKTPLEVAGILAVIAYTILTYFMWREMHSSTTAAQKSVNAAQAQLELIGRPWLTVDFTVEPPGFVFTKDGSVQIAFRAHIKNVGHSAANKIVIPMNIFLAMDANGIFNEPEKRQKQLCDKVAHDPKYDAGLPIVLFPGETDNNQILGGAISKADVQSKYLRNESHPEMRDRLLPIVFGCVDYQYGASERHHQTGFIYEIQWLDRTVPNGTYPIRAIRANKSVPAPDVVIQKYGFDGFYAQ